VSDPTAESQQPVCLDVADGRSIVTSECDIPGVQRRSVCRIYE